MRQESEPLFDAHAWARETLFDAPALKPETLSVAAGFTFLWNMFDGVACAKGASIAELDRVADRLAHSQCLAKNTLEESLAFYRFRYVKDGRVNDRFHGLHFRKNDRQKLVEAVLIGEHTSLHHKLLALLIIVYRIRNNMFHGLKSVHEWDDQAKNISEASRIR